LKGGGGVREKGEKISDVRRKSLMQRNVQQRGGRALCAVKKDLEEGTGNIVGDHGTPKGGGKGRGEGESPCYCVWALYG